MRTNLRAVIMLCAVLWVASAAAESPGEYTATLDRVIDGDTVDLMVSRSYVDPELDVTVTVSRTMRFRLSGVDAPELHGATKAAGEAAKAFLAKWLAKCHTLAFTSVGTEKYGRRLAAIQCDGEDAAAALLAAGHARPYNGGAR